MASYAPGFITELADAGYTPLSATLQLRLAAEVSRWLTVQGLDVAGLTAGTAEQFMAARRVSGSPRFTTVKALRPLMSHLARSGVAAPVLRPPTVSPVDALLERYHAYLTGERGLAGSTAGYYVYFVRPFLTGRAGPDGIDLAGLTAGDVTGFVLAAAPLRAKGSAKLLVTALRSLLRFLYLQGLIGQSLTAAVPSVAGWRLAGLPGGLNPDQVRRLLAGCDRDTVTGRRDAAILLLLVRLGLRAGEVAALRLDDIDWRAGEVIVHGKGHRVERLPLPVDVGAAIAGYLRGGRPATAVGRSVFIRVKAPHVALAAAGVSQVVATAGARAGLVGVHAHQLRHTAATALVAAGASLPEVSQVLRHRSVLSTAIYAKVDRSGLAVLAQPWPGGAA